MRWPVPRRRWTTAWNRTRTPMRTPMRTLTAPPTCAAAWTSSRRTKRRWTSAGRSRPKLTRRRSKTLARKTGTMMTAATTTRVRARLVLGPKLAFVTTCAVVADTLTHLRCVWQATASWSRAWRLLRGSAWAATSHARARTRWWRTTLRWRRAAATRTRHWCSSSLPHAARRLTPRPPAAQPCALTALAPMCWTPTLRAW